MKVNAACSILSRIYYYFLSRLCYHTSLKHFMDGVENDPQCIRESVVDFLCCLLFIMGLGNT